MATPPKYHRYSRKQLGKYLQAINNNSSSVTLEAVESQIQKDPLATLGSLLIKHLAFNPWGNVGLHYSPSRNVSLAPETLYTKIVERRIGGYCMENNTLFSTVLRSLGYELYTVGARIGVALESKTANPESFNGLGHQVIIVTIAGQKYLVDVGFSTYFSLTPIPIPDPDSPQASLSGSPPIYKGIPGLNIRLVHRPIGTFVSTTQKFWVLELEIPNPESPRDWFPGYCFTDTEFLPQDYEVMNYHCSHDLRSWFTYQFVITRILIEEESGKPKAVGSIVFNGDEVTKRSGEIGEKKEVLRKCTTEEERVDALDRWFGVKLNQAEVDGIKGLPSEIKGTLDL